MRIRQVRHWSLTARNFLFCCLNSHCLMTWCIEPVIMFCRIIADGTTRETGRLFWEERQHIVHLLYRFLKRNKLILWTCIVNACQCLILCLCVWLGSYPSWTWGCSHSTTCSICLSDFEELRCTDNSWICKTYVSLLGEMHGTGTTRWTFFTFGEFGHLGQWTKNMLEIKSWWVANAGKALKALKGMCMAFESCILQTFWAGHALSFQSAKALWLPCRVIQ